METLIRYLESIHPLTKELKQHLAGILMHQEIPRRGYMLRAGQVCRNAYFIQKGLFRCFYIRQDKEVSSWFMKELDVIFSVHSFYNQVESYESIQALEDASVWYISFEQLQEVYTRFPEFNMIRGRLTEYYYDLSEQRLYAIRMMRAKERYDFLASSHPELIERVPAKFIASYLGISEQTLSRIRNGLKN